MKPVKLEIQAMGPYKNREIIDFTRLGGKRFFLIHGPTGAGKSSILDAMTYALYGETSGDERSLEQMRSQWADGDTESYVIFEFFIGSRLYRIRRSPRQTLNKKRGTGTREVNPDAVLSLTDENERVIETGASKVTEKIEKLLGFNSSQFRQVIILPQGKFRELLAAKAEGREEILKVLFGTERFSHIQDMIRERSGDVKRKLDALYLERDAILRGEGAESVDELAAKAISFKKDAEALKEELKKHESEEKKLQEEMKAAAIIEERYVERDMAAEALKSLEDRETEINRYTEAIESRKRASSLSDIYKSLSDDRMLFSDSEMKYNICREELASAEKRKSEAEKLIKEIPEKKENLKSAEKELHRLEPCIELYDEIGKTDKEIEVNEKIKTEAEKRALTCAERKRELEKYMQTLRQQISESELSGAKISVLKMSLERITLSGRKIADIEKMAADIAKIEKDIPFLEKKHEALTAKLDKIRSKRAASEDMWRRGQAFLLAAGLKEGETCPVCGSLHHPAPAGSSAETPGIDEIEHLRAGEKTTDDEARELEKEIIKKRTELKSAKSQMKSVDDIPDAHRSLTRDELKKKYREESAELERESRKASELEFLKSRLSDSEKNAAELDAEFESSSAMVKEADIKQAALKSRRSQLGSWLPEGISNNNELLGIIASLKKRAGELALDIINSENQWKDASEKFSAAAALYKKNEEDYRSSGERLGAKEIEFSKRLKLEGFDSESDFTGLLHGADKAKELEAIVEQYRSDLISAKGRLERASTAIKDSVRPEISIITRKINSVKSEIEQIIGRMKSAESETQRLDKIAARIRLIEQSAASEDQEYGVIQKLSEIIGGKNSRRLTFQRYVLQTLFEEVLIIASNRLEKMSRGRYRLISPGKIEDRRMSGGLDLEVFDEYTGYSRPVVTLSGGEAFLASLSLALGLADLVQQYAGGMRLDTVFIDEGFGSLDSETLDLAINTLIDLQSSGRLVGIISHVNELKERIDARLEVLPVACGSTTRFTV